MVGLDGRYIIYTADSAALGRLAEKTHCMILTPKANTHTYTYNYYTMLCFDIGKTLFWVY